MNLWIVEFATQHDLPDPAREQSQECQDHAENARADCRARAISHWQVTQDAEVRGSVTAIRGDRRYSRVTITPATISSADSAFSAPNRSPNANQPIRTANRIEVSRNAATRAIGALVIAQTEML